MHKFYSTVKSLERDNHPAAYLVDGFAEIHNPPEAKWNYGLKWDFNTLSEDLSNENLYHVEYVCPIKPGSRLTFTIECFPNQPGQSPRFTLIEKTYSSQ